jgi:hypothetical protein
MHVRFITAGEDRLIDLLKPRQLAPRPSRPESSACRTIKEGVSNRVPTGQPVVSPQGYGLLSVVDEGAAT